MSLRIRKEDISLLFSVCFIWLGAFNNFVSSRLGGVVYIALSFLLLLLSTDSGIISFKQEHHSMKNVAIAFFCFVVVTFLGYELFHEKSATNHFLVFDFSADGFNVFKNFPLWFTGIFLAVKEENKALKIRKWFCAILIYNICVSLIALHVQPAFAKNTAAGIVTPGMEIYVDLGAMGYRFTYVIALITPLLYYISYKEKNYGLIGVSVLCCYYVYKCSFFIALAALLINCIIAVGWNAIEEGNYLARFFSIILIITLLLLFLQKNRFANILLDLSYMTSSIQLKERFFQLSQMLLYGDMSGGTLSRFDLYIESLQGIVKEPLLGVSFFYPTYDVSGHSTILDTWALFGIAGILPLVLTIKYSLQFALSCLGVNDKMRNIVKAAYVTFVFVAVVNPILADPQILLSILWIIPVLVRSYKLIIEENSHENS